MEKYSSFCNDIRIWPGICSGTTQCFHKSGLFLSVSHQFLVQSHTISCNDKEKEMSKSSPWVVFCEFHGLSLFSLHMKQVKYEIEKQKEKGALTNTLLRLSLVFLLSHLPFPEWFLRGKKHLKHTLDPDPGPTASSFLWWSRQKTRKWALWDNSHTSFIYMSTFMLQVLEKKGFVDAHLSFPLSALLVFSALKSPPPWQSKSHSIWYHAKDLELNVTLWLPLALTIAAWWRYGFCNDPVK